MCNGRRKDHYVYRVYGTIGETVIAKRTVLADNDVK